MASVPAPVAGLTTLDEVVQALSSIIEWSTNDSNRLGYFAALYKRITIAVGAAIEQGAFHNGQLMERFDVAFAQRYFDAINGHLHPAQFSRPTRSWQVAFDAAARPEPIIVQHMLGGIMAHILLDLGIVTREISPRLSEVREDFDTINAVLASQVEGIVLDINELSPALAEVYAVLRQNQIFVIVEVFRQTRDSAWRFGSVLAAEPSFARPATIWFRDRQIAAQAATCYRPPPLTQTLIDRVGDRESRDIVRNLHVLDEIASTPAPIKTAL
ncbi:DUF5995 family protein [Mycobacterium sp. GA-2829]|uniref:DUF5995 family protein n=1 Tax=Mycobacterium sp. GA-2829 TaxID=1772283 RepID=UPI00073FE6A3|nr:DUF5995 family protein [Mycobacterium sp. GA-2829]KUI29348.1 hypothetical protein AU194_21005 [Mycobacterium sp. GA-2829]